MSSLRDLYNDPTSHWSFQPEPATTNSTPGSGPSTSFQWTSRPTPTQSSIFDLSPDLNDVSDIDLVQIFKTVIASSMLQYTSTAIAMPWEVGKLLLQVQWVPRDVQHSDLVVEAEEDEDETSDSEGEGDSYFADPEVPSAASPHSFVEEQMPLYQENARPEYIIPVGKQDGVWGMIKRLAAFRGEGWLALWKGLLTSWVTEVLSLTIQPIIHSTLQSLLLPTTPLFVSNHNTQPLLLPITVSSHLLTGLLLSPLDLIRTRLIVQSLNPHHRSYSGPIDAFSQILHSEGGIKGIYLHPHLLIPTVIDCTLRPLVSLALPGMMASYIRVGARSGSGITEEHNPIAWGIAELAGSCIGLLITLPFETIRRRLQVQVRGTSTSTGMGTGTGMGTSTGTGMGTSTSTANPKPKPIKGCVELRPTPYHGVVDALWHILTEERSDVPPSRRRIQRNRNQNQKRRRTSGGVSTTTTTTAGSGPGAGSGLGSYEHGKERGEDKSGVVSFEEAHDGWFKNTGIAQLYRGLSMRLGASVIVFVLAVVSGGEDSDGGWAEL